MIKRGQCFLSVIPVRSEPKSQSEIVTQLLFGERYEVVEAGEEWTKIVTEYDSYPGYISSNQFHNVEFEQGVVQSSELIHNYQGIQVPLGGELPNALSLQPSQNRLLDTASLFYGSPYLWGGRTFMGIDCSGFVQVVHKAHNIVLPRDASQQYLRGEEVSLDSAEYGDLVFFENAKGKIHHVGIYGGRGDIIHASGSVRVDRLTEQGIEHSESGKVTHKLAGIRRLL